LRIEKGAFNLDRGEIKRRLLEYAAKGYEVPRMDMIKTPEQIAGIREAGKLNTEVLDAVEKEIKVGMTTDEIDKIVYDYTVSHDGTPACLNYEGFPKSVCTSINDVICHGIPSPNDVLKSGDIVNVDATTIYKGYVGDASRMFMIGNVSAERKNLVGITKECLRRGTLSAKGWVNTLGDIGASIQAFAHKHGYSVVREFGGHGVGLSMHEDPFVSHVGKKGTGMLLVPGMVITIEPMINQGHPDLYIDSVDNWTVRTVDGKSSAQWEYTLLITEGEPEILSH
jgi:methionyl aminopeptidase